MPTGRARIDIKFKQSNRTVSGTATAKAAVVGVLERGPFTKQTIYSDGDFAKLFGGVISNANAEIPQNIKQFFDNGGTELVIQRICHYTDLTDPSTYIATKGTINLLNSGSAATAATKDTSAATFELDPGDNFTVEVDNGGNEVVTFDAAAAYVTDTTTYPVSDQDGKTVTVSINGGTTQTATFSGVTQTAASVVNQLNAQLTGVQVSEVGGQVKIITDKQGTGATIGTIGGTNDLTFPASTAGTGDVVDIKAVTATEFKTVFEADTTGATCTVNGDSTVTIDSDTTGVTSELDFKSGDLTKFGLSVEVINGTDASPENTLKVDGKTEGAYANNLTIQIAAASNGQAESFNFYVLDGGTATETFENCTMDDTDTKFYVETVVNDTNTGSNLVQVTDLDVVGTVLQQRPANGTSSNLTGGDDGLTGLVDADFLGNQAGPTGLYCFDDDEDIRLVGIPGRSSATIHAGLNAYESYRRGLNQRVYVVHPTPKLTDVANTSAMRTYAVANLYGSTEFGCCSWPRIAIVNPSTSVFGTGDTIYVDSSMSKMGAFARNDRNHPDGVLTSTAGVNQEAGTIIGCVGVESDDMKDPNKRNVLADVNIEPIVKFTGTNWHWDGGDNLKTDGDWPRQWHARGAIWIVASIKKGSLWTKHSKNNDKTRGDWERQGTDFLNTLPQDAFDPDRLTYFQCNEYLNPPAVRSSQQMKGKLGLGFSDDAKFVEIEVTRSPAVTAS